MQHSHKILGIFLVLALSLNMPISGISFPNISKENQNSLKTIGLVAFAASGWAYSYFRKPKTEYVTSSTISPEELKRYAEQAHCTVQRDNDGVLTLINNFVTLFTQAVPEDQRPDLAADKALEALIQRKAPKFVYIPDLSGINVISKSKAEETNNQQ